MLAVLENQSHGNERYMKDEKQQGKTEKRSGNTVSQPARNPHLRWRGGGIGKKQCIGAEKLAGLAWLGIAQNAEMPSCLFEQIGRDLAKYVWWTVGSEILSLLPRYS